MSNHLPTSLPALDSALLLATTFLTLPGIAQDHHRSPVDWVNPLGGMYSTRASSRRNLCPAVAVPLGMNARTPPRALSPNLTRGTGSLDRPKILPPGSEKALTEPR